MPITNRIPEAPVAESPREDTTARVISRIVRAKPRVLIGKLWPNGDITFSLLYPSLGIRPREVCSMSLLRYGLVADFLGRFLILTNLQEFMPLILDCDYPQHVRRFAHLQVGLAFNDQQMQFRVPVALLHWLINEAIAKQVGTEQSSVTWNWDFLHRAPPNPPEESGWNC